MLSVCERLSAGERAVAAEAVAMQERLLHGRRVSHPASMPRQGVTWSTRKQAVAAEAVALEERLLQARSAQLMAGREAGAGREQARRASAQAASAAAERASLQDTIDMLQVPPPTCHRVLAWRKSRRFRGSGSASTASSLLSCLHRRASLQDTIDPPQVLPSTSRTITSASHLLQEERRTLQARLRTAVLGARAAAEAPPRDAGTQTEPPPPLAANSVSLAVPAAAEPPASSSEGGAQEADHSRAPGPAQVSAAAAPIMISGCRASRILLARKRTVRLVCMHACRLGMRPSRPWQPPCWRRGTCAGSDWGACICMAKRADSMKRADEGPSRGWPLHQTTNTAKTSSGYR